MKIIGISGGIASGKNFIANFLAKKLNATIFDADLEVHKILEFDQKAIDEIAKYFPSSLENVKINRQILGNIVFEDDNKLEILEKIIHKKVRKNYENFLKSCQNKGDEFVILNIPLLLEKKGYDYDILIAISIFPSIQKQRFIKREKNLKKNNFKNLEEKFYQITKKQFNNSQRIKNADFVIKNNFSKKNLVLQINEIVKNI